MRRLAAAFLVLVLTTAPVLAGDGAIETKLYFGLGLKGGGRVSDKQWQHFLADTVTPRFPDGLTIVSATGQWRDPKARDARVTTEPTRIVVIVHPETVATAKAIGEIKDVYVKRFHQDSVLQTDTPVRIVN